MFLALNNPESILEVCRVTQSFRSGFGFKRSDVLHSVDLNIPRNSIFGFLGPNGAGKTTLIHLMAGLNKPTQGHIRIAGLDATHPEARAHIGFLPERPYFYPHLTGEGLLRYFGTLSGMSSVQIRSRISEILNWAGLQDARKKELRHYSKGMLQRIGIAQAILHDPEVLILDEPMSGLDAVGRIEVRNLMVRLAERGKTLFFSSHVVSDIEAICDQVGLIVKGRIVKCGSVSELIADAPSSEFAFKKPSLENYFEKVMDHEA